MKVADLEPPIEDSAAFSLYTLQRVESGAGCYVLTNASGDILYIGQALSISARLQKHFDGPKRGMLTQYGRISVVHWRVGPRQKLNALERGWLESVRLRDGELPPLNQVSAPV